MQPTSEEINLAIKNLAEKTGLRVGRCSEFNGLPPELTGRDDAIYVRIKTELNEQDVPTKGIEAVLKEHGIDFEPAWKTRDRSTQKNMKAAFADPVVIKAMANNQFSLSPVETFNRDENIQVAAFLTQKTKMQCSAMKLLRLC